MNALFVLRPAKLRAFNFGHPCPFMNALLVSHPCETLGVQLRASMPLYERSVGFASLRNSGRSTSGVHARPLSKVRCCRPKKFGRLPKGLPPVAPNTAIPTTLLKAHHAFRHTNPFQNRTIPRKALNLPPLSKVRCCRPKKFGRLPEGLPPVALNTAIPQSSQKYNHPLLRTTFFHPLSKVGYCPTNSTISSL